MKCLVLLVALFVANGVAAEKWIRLKTPNFEVITSQNERKAKETALYFERLREFFLSFWGVQAPPETPVRIVLFSNAKQFEPFRPHQKTAGYFQHGMDREWIVLGGDRDGWERVVAHEYTHLMVRQAALPLPVWLNEGLAEIYSTFKPVGDKVQVGNLLPEHFQAVQQGWIPVERVFEVRHDSPEYGGNGTHQFYAESWGMAHLMMLSPDHQKVYGPLLQQLAKGEDWHKVLAAANLSAKEVDLTLRDYLKRNDRFYMSTLPYKSKPVEVAVEVERLVEGEVETVFALLQLNMQQKLAEGTQRVAKLDPKLWQTWEARGYAAWRTNDLKVAADSFAKAIQMGATNPKLFFDAARMAMYAQDRTAPSVGYLERAIELFPAWSEARLQLMEQHMFMGDAQKALDVGGQFKKITPAEASRLFRGIAYAEAQLRGVKVAQISAKRARDYARTDMDKEQCERLEDFLTRVEKVAQAKSREVNLSEEMVEVRKSADRISARLFVESIGEPVTDAPRIERRVVVRGTLVRMDCEQQYPVLEVRNSDGGGQVMVEMRDPKKVNLQLVRAGEAVQSLDLACGVQSRQVRMSFSPAAEGQKLGQLKTIEYLD